jgi:hypothetical protein
LTPSQQDQLDRLTNVKNQKLEYFQDWIETDSEEIGYSKSLISKFIAWLDRLMLRFENWVVKIWNAITNYPTQS